MYNINWLLEKYKKGENLKCLFFWGHKSKNNEVGKNCLSQWYDCKFTVDDIEYHTAEQYMMAQKAVLFKDKTVFEKIMSSSEPSEYKKFGRLIKGFDEKVWDAEKCNIVIKGNTAKFSQNEDLKQFLLNTNSRILVEASPYDKIWGIGLAEYNCNPTQWQGSNLLGFCLMEVRDIVR